MNYEPESEWFLGHDTPKGQMAISMFFYPDNERIYVDLGCAHPINKSLTHFVRDLGWRGVAVDANPAYALDWQKAGFGEHFECAILSDQPEVRFAFHENSFTSRISPTEATDHPERWGIDAIVTAPTTPLNRILEQRGIGRIDLLTIDLEGHEFALLQTLDFEKHTPAFIISEYVTAGEGVDTRACCFLLGKGYEVVHMTESNIIYRRK